jgi:hypothetical protein
VRPRQVALQPSHRIVGHFAAERKDGGVGILAACDGGHPQPLQVLGREHPPDFALMEIGAFPGQPCPLPEELALIFPDPDEELFLLPEIEGAGSVWP